MYKETKVLYIFSIFIMLTGCVAIYNKQGTINIKKDYTFGVKVK